MELLRFYKLFGPLVEYLFIVPLVAGFLKWKKLDAALRWIVIYLFLDFTISLVSNYIYKVLGTNNLFLFYFYSFFWNITVCGFFYRVSGARRSILFLLVLGCALVVLDYVLTAGDQGMNYGSGLFLNLVLFGLSTYYLFTKMDSMEANTPLLLIFLALTIQFFIRSLDIFSKKYLLQSVYYGVFWFYEAIIYGYVMLLANAIFTYAFYLVKVKR